MNGYTALETEDIAGADIFTGDMTDPDIKNALESCLRTYGGYGGAVRAVTKDGQLVDMLMK